MSYIRISNESFFDKDFDKTFVNQDKYKFFNLGDSFSTLLPFYKELLRGVIGNKVDETFKDYELNFSKTQSIQEVIKNQLETELSFRVVTGKPPHKDIEFKGKTYSLDLRLTSPTDRRIDDYFKIYSICQECLDEGKPMYLSIE